MEHISVIPCGKSAIFEGEDFSPQRRVIFPNIDSLIMRKNDMYEI